VAGSAANFDVNGAAGTIAIPSGSQQQMAHLGQISARDVDVQITVGFPTAPTGSNRFFGYLLLRRQGGGAHYRVGLYVTSGGQVAIRGQTSSGIDLFSDVTTGLALSPGDTFLLRVQAQGAIPTTIRARAWEQGTVEPSSWQATGTDSTSALQAAGSIGVRGIATGSQSTTLAFDNFVAQQL
jgi:hypothetical protein